MWSRFLCVSLHHMPNTHLFPVNQAIESIFSPKNIDKDCRNISRLMLPVENAIEQYLFDGDYTGAVEMFLQLVDSMCYHFVEDKHWNYFDDFYAPEYDADRCWRLIRGCLEKFPEALFDELEEGLIDLSETDAFQDYCCPRIGGWLKDMKKMYS